MWQAFPVAGVLAANGGHMLMVLHERDDIRLTN